MNSYWFLLWQQPHWASFPQLEHTYTSCALSLWVQVGFNGSQASVFSLSATGRQGKHTVVMYILTSAPFKEQSARITKRGKTSGMKASRMISHGVIIINPLWLIIGDRQQRWVCAISWSLKHETCRSSHWTSAHWLKPSLLSVRVLTGCKFTIFISVE